MKDINFDSLNKSINIIDFQILSRKLTNNSEDLTIFILCSEPLTNYGLRERDHYTYFNRIDSISVDGTKILYTDYNAFSTQKALPSIASNRMLQVILPLLNFKLIFFKQQLTDKISTDTQNVLKRMFSSFKLSKVDKYFVSQSFQTANGNKKTDLIKQFDEFINLNFNRKIPNVVIQATDQKIEKDMNLNVEINIDNLSDCEFNDDNSMNAISDSENKDYDEINYVEENGFTFKESTNNHNSINAVYVETNNNNSIIISPDLISSSKASNVDRIKQKFPGCSDSSSLCDEDANINDVFNENSTNSDVLLNLVKNHKKLENEKLNSKISLNYINQKINVSNDFNCIKNNVSDTNSDESLLDKIVYKLSSIFDSKHLNSILSYLIFLIDTNNLDSLRFSSIIMVPSTPSRYIYRFQLEHNFNDIYIFVNLFIIMKNGKLMLLLNIPNIVTKTEIITSDVLLDFSALNTLETYILKDFILMSNNYMYNNELLGYYHTMQ